MGLGLRWHSYSYPLYFEWINGTDVDDKMKDLPDFMSQKFFDIVIPKILWSYLHDRQEVISVW
ncbi:hypothetical protein TUM19329_25510 [Legionella antarctica]|uniref:Uncharacterized protein n=1 Tax=Legionella antarctica TaxID=2708020 RepID=A0A6F8T7S0_9GAMM|nr:hypothetical protein TUM19329_25510 [Legionella antarctica]